MLTFFFFFWEYENNLNLSVSFSWALRSETQLLSFSTLCFYDTYMSFTDSWALVFHSWVKLLRIHENDQAWGQHGASSSFSSPQKPQRLLQRKAWQELWKNQSCLAFSCNHVIWQILLSTIVTHPYPHPMCLGSFYSPVLQGSIIFLQNRFDLVAWREGLELSQNAMILRAGSVGTDLVPVPAMTHINVESWASHLSELHCLYL